MNTMAPKNGVYIVQGEINLVVTAMRRTNRWTTHSHLDDEQDPLLNSYSQLKEVLNGTTELDELEPNVFLSPFLEVVRSEDTTGPITGLALSSINKFLSYGLVNPDVESSAAAIENVADAVTHARFVGTDPGSDEVVLMKILHVLRTLLLSPAGCKLTNESVCEIMQSCFRITFEMRLSELLRKCAEHTLMDMVQLVFSRLPQFKEDTRWAHNLSKKLKLRAASSTDTRGGKKRKISKSKVKKSAPTRQDGSAPDGSSASGLGVAGSDQHASFTESTETVASELDTETATVSSLEGAPLGVDGRFENGDSKEDLSRTANTETTDSIPDHQTAPRMVLLGEAPPSEYVDGAEEREPDMTQTIERDDGNGETAGLSMETYAKDTTEEKDGNETDDSSIPVITIATTPVASTRSVVDIHESFQDGSFVQETITEEHQTYKEHSIDLSSSHLTAQDHNDIKKSSSEAEFDQLSCPSELGDDQESVHSAADQSDGASVHDADYVNPRGVRFTQLQQSKEGSGPMIPYGLPCVRELFRFLISLTNPLDRHNNDVMIHMGLSLLTVALEAGADHLASYNSLVMLIKDDMCRNLFSLLQIERLSLFTAALRVCFLLFESCRSHLKFQLETYLTKLMDIIVSESPRTTYEQKEIALESVVQLWRIPGLITELYLNYDCDIYCSNLFEDLTKLLSKNAFPVAGLYTTHLLSLDALLTVVDSIEQHCHSRILNATKQQQPPDEVMKSSVKFALGDEVKEDVETPTAPNQYNVPPPPAVSAFSSPRPSSTDVSSSEPQSNKPRTAKSRGPTIKPNRMKVTESLPNDEELATIKRRKKLLQSGTEQFNVKPAKGITFLQEHGLLSTPLNQGEVVTFLKENPRLDKKMIGEYIASKKNPKVLEAFVKSFMFEDLRIDEALRLYLETFRLPGEAPVISYLLEHFAEHWHKSNGEPFAHVDVAFTLAYAVIMLNVDQHNHNVKKQSNPMTIQEFKKNLKGVNGGQDFEEEMVEDIFHAIRSDEIVMPAEQVGLVRENYLWKVLLRRGQTKEVHFVHTPTGSYDHDLFTLIWGPTVAALSFVFDKSMDDTIVQKAVSGFRKCAMISAHYGLSDVFDNLVISLCKFTTLLSTMESPENIPISFGNNSKAQLAARTMFGLAHRHGDILREGWKNILDCLHQLYTAKLLPKALVEVEDFLDPNGKVSLIREEAQAQRQETGVLSSFYSYFTMSEPAAQRGPTAEEQEAIKVAHMCIKDCHIEQLIVDSKFLRMDSLQELIKALAFAAQGHLHQDSINSHYDEDASVFYLELLIRVVVQNRDRVQPIWQSVRDYFYNILVNASEPSFLVERAVVGLLRLATRLIRREDVAPQILTSLRLLVLMKSSVIHSVSRQVSFGLHELLRGNAANIHEADDWYTLFTLLEVVGAGANPPQILRAEAGCDDTVSDSGVQSDSELCTIESDGDKGYISDSEVYEARHTRSISSPDLDVRAAAGSWLLVGGHSASRDQEKNQYNIVLDGEIKHHDSKALLKSCETLAFLVRDAAHVTPYNFESCVHCIRTFVEASLHGGPPSKPHSRTPSVRDKKNRRKEMMKRSKSSPVHLQHQVSDDESEEVGTGGYHLLSIQLLDLMHTLHTRAASIFSSWAETDELGEDASEATPSTSTTTPSTPSGPASTGGTSTGALWSKCWCPLLQGIARLCCDTRRQVRSQALTYLQRALLVHDLQTLSATEWEACFNKVLFPLLSKLLDNFASNDPNGLEETRMRAATLLCKVFLQHLSPLLSLATFTALWLTILEFMDKYMHVEQSDLLYEAIPESLKNMLLVMDTAGIFELSGSEQEMQLWKLTWDRIDTFLPHLRSEVFKSHDKGGPKRDSRSASPIVEKPAERPSSPLADAQPRPMSCILQPPLPDPAVRPEVTLEAAETKPPDALTTVPILLNPDILQHTAVPIISPQGTPEKTPAVAAQPAEPQ